MLRTLFFKPGQVRQFAISPAFRAEPVDPSPPTGSSATPTIPPFEDKFEEPLAQKRARLIYQSRKRGIRENGLLLATFADKHLANFDQNELALYDRLINLPSNDWEIYYWATGAKPTPAEFDNDVMDLLKKHTKNKDKESRYHLPELKQ